MKKTVLIFIFFITSRLFAQLQVSPQCLTFSFVQGQPWYVNKQEIIITDKSGSKIQWVWDESIYNSYPGYPYCFAVPTVFYVTDSLSLTPMVGQTYNSGFTPQKKIFINAGYCGRADQLAVGTYKDSMIFMDINHPSNKVTLCINLTVLAKSIPDPTFSYPDKTLYRSQCWGNESSNNPGYYFGDSASCNTPNQFPPGPFTVPAVGGSYKDPTFGGKVKVISDGAKPSARSPISAHNKYAIVVNNYSSIISVATGAIVQADVKLSSGQQAVFNPVWDACDDEIYYTFDNGKIQKVAVGAYNGTTLIDYSQPPYNLSYVAAGSSNGTKDNWIAWFAPGEKKVGVYNIKKNETYMADFSVYEGNLPFQAIDIQQDMYPLLSKGYDKVSGKRYFMLMCSPSAMFFSVDTITKKLNFEFRGPEIPKEAFGDHTQMNGDNICNPGEHCFTGSRISIDSFEDCDGNQYLVQINDPTSVACTWARTVSTFLIRAGLNMFMPIEAGGGAKHVFPLCWANDAHNIEVVQGAKNSPYFVVAKLQEEPFVPVGDTLPTSVVQGGPYAGDIMLVGIINGKYDVKRVARHRSRPYQYSDHPFPKVSDDGSLIIYNTNFGHPGVSKTAIVETGVTPILKDSLTVLATSTPATCLNNDGVATVAGVSNQHCGSRVYSYSWSNGATGMTTTGLSSGTYTVTVADVHGCDHGSTTVVVNKNNVTGVLALTSTKTDASCNGSNGTATVATISTGALTYSWNNGGSASTVSNLAAGIYTVTVTLTGACSATGTKTVSVGNAASFTSSATATDPKCYGGKGSVAATVSGASGPLTYSWNNGATTSTISNLSAGTYTITIKDQNNCTATATASLVEPKDIFANATQVNSALCQSNSGTAQVAANGGTGPFSYSWSNGATGQTASGFYAGNYIVTVTDANGCTQTAGFGILKSGIIGLSYGSQLSCLGGKNGHGFVEVKGGTAPYTYSWSNGVTFVSNKSNETVDSLTGGVHSVTVTDAIGCIYTGYFTNVTPPDPIRGENTITNANCGNADGSVYVFPKGGNWTGWKFSWSNGATTQTVTGLGSGTYYLTITDIYGCTGIDTANVSSSGGPSIAMNAVNVSCKSPNDGTATVTANNGIPPYTYSWSNGTTTTTATTSNQITGLAAGNYIVTVTDSTGCPSIASVPVKGSSPLVITSLSTNANCSSSTGSVSATVTGGSGTGYTFSWTGGSTSSASTGLPPGTYTVTVADGAGCSATATAKVNSFSNASITMNAHTNATCNAGKDGAASVTANSGTIPFTYSWSNGQTTASNSTTNQVSGLAPGLYIVTVTDAGGCSNIASVTITAPSAIVAKPVSTNASCGSNNGTVSVTASGGTGTNYIYSWNGIGIAQSGSGMVPGIYTVSVTDDAGCTVTASTQVNNSGGPTITMNAPTNIICYGDSNGTASVTASSGTSPFTYSWSNGITATTTSSTNQVTGLVAGNYNVTITDASGCSGSASVTLTAPSAVTAIASSTNANCGSSNGSVSATASGGTGKIYTYSWTGNGTISTITGLGAGSYTVTTTDGAGCTAIATAQINNSGGPTVSISSSTNVTCSGNNNGAAGVNATGGTPPYLYSWSNGTTISSTATTNQVTGLSAGNYSASVTDASGCSNTTSVTIASPGAVTINLTSTNASCGNNNGTGSANATGGTGTVYTYSWTTGSTIKTITGLTAGTYSVTVTDMNGCSTISSMQITSQGGPTASVSGGGNISLGSSVQLGASGGATYIWSPPVNLSCINCPNPLAQPTESTWYIVKVTDAFGCSDRDSVFIKVKTELPEIFVPSAFSPNGDGNNDILFVMGAITDIYFEVYSRWGEKVFESTSTSQGWDGTFSGQKLNSGVYAYKLSGKNYAGETVKLGGNITLMR